MSEYNKDDMLKNMGKFIGQHLIKEEEVKEMVMLIPGASQETKDKMWHIINNTITSAQTVGQLQVVYAQTTGEELPIFNNPHAQCELDKHNLPKMLQDITDKKAWLKKLKIPDGKENR